MELLRIGDALVRDAIRDAAATAPPGVCPFCGGFAMLFEQIDEERHAVAVPCHHCRVYCAACKRDVPRAGHECNGDRNR